MNFDDMDLVDYNENLVDIVTPVTAQLILLGLFAKKGKLVKVELSYRMKEDSLSEQEAVFSIEGDIAETIRNLEISVDMTRKSDVSKRDVIDTLRKAIKTKE